MTLVSGTLLTMAIAVVVGVVILMILFRSMWRVAEPDEALIISGIRQSRPGQDGKGFKSVAGHGTFVVPGLQTVRRLSLKLHESELDISCVTQQGIPVGVKGVVIYKIGDDEASISNAARRFLDQQDKMDTQIQNVFSGHLRAVVGSLTIEELIRDRDKLTDAVRTAAGDEMAKLGLIIDSLQIQEIDDPTGYIKNLAKPHTVEVEKAARIAAAQADQEATQREQEALANKAAYVRDTQIKQAQFKSETDKANAEAAQAGPLADTTARQNVVLQETKTAELEAQRKEQELQATVRRPADAEAYAITVKASANRDAAIATAQGDAQRVKLDAEAQADAKRAIGNAEADANRARGIADGDATRAKGLAEADAIKARSAALAENQEAVINQQLAENAPAIVAEAAKAFAHIGNLTVLNGAEGVSELFGKVISTGMVGLKVLGSVLQKDGSGNSTPGASNGSKGTSAITTGSAKE